MSNRDQYFDFFHFNKAEFKRQMQLLGIGVSNPNHFIGLLLILVSLVEHKIVNYRPDCFQLQIEVFYLTNCLCEPSQLGILFERPQTHSFIPFFL